MLAPPTIGVMIFAAIWAGALVGWLVGQRLPSHHTTEETIIRLNRMLRL